MKQLAILFLLCCIALSITAQETVINGPAFSVAKSRAYQIEKITLRDTVAIFDMIGINNPGWWIMLQKDVRLEAGGKTYAMRRAENIEIGKETYTDEKGEHRFRVFFDPIPADIKQIDYVGGSFTGIFGIELQSDVLTNRIPLPAGAQQALNIVDDGNPLVAPELKDGTARIKGQLLAYRPALDYGINVYVNNPVLGNQETYKTKPNDEGIFELDVPLSFAQSVLFRIEYDGRIFYNNYILLAPEEETGIYVDLQQKACQESLFRKDKCDEGQYIFFTGTYSEINNQMNQPLVGKFIEYFGDSNRMTKDIAGMDMIQYRDYQTKRLAGIIEMLPNLNLTKKATEFLSLKMEYIIFSQLMFGDSYLKNAYREVNNVKNEEGMKDFKEPEKTVEYYTFLNGSSINNPVSLLVPGHEGVVNSCKYIGNGVYDKKPSMAGLRRLATMESLSEEEQKVLDSMASDNQDSAMLKASQELRKKYKEAYNSILVKERIDDVKNHLSGIVGADKGILFDLVEASYYGSNFDRYELLNKYQLMFLSEMDNPFYYAYLYKKNEELKALFEANKKKTGYTVHPNPETEEVDLLFAEILKPFEGKLILIDFWETWCGPCRYAMERFEQAKERLKAKGVVFLYLASESSALLAWENMITDITGNHYRLTNNQMKALSQKFGIRSIPTYMIINQQGEQIYFKSSSAAVDELEQILNKAL